MAGVETQTVQQALTNPIHLGTVGREIETEAQMQALGGTGLYRSQQVQAAPAFSAQEIVENALEAGAGALLRGNRPLAGRAAGGAPAASAKGATHEFDDSGSATADDGPEAVVRRIRAFIALSRDTGGGGAGAGGQQDQRHRGEPPLARIKGASDAQSRALTSRLSAIAASGLDGERLLAAIRETLRGFSDDPVQQLLALEAVRTGSLHTGSHGEAFADALERIQHEFETGIDGTQMRLAVRDAYIALSLHRAAQAAAATRDTDPVAMRLSLRQQLGGADRALMAGELKHALDRLTAADDDHVAAGAMLREMFATHLQAAGHELSAGEGHAMEAAHLAGLLTEIAALKMLNSVYDATTDLIANSLLEPDERFNAAGVMSGMLAFVADPEPDPDTGGERLDALLPHDVIAIDPVTRQRKGVDLDARILFSTNLDTMHRALPEWLFPGDDDEARARAWRAQNTAILTLRDRLAHQEALIFAA